ncbi:MAG: glycosyltransferase [Alphaproteobacteria bacterium]|nr:glycosyltransferase [Alphaproteobacteria bacterium]
MNVLQLVSATRPDAQGRASVTGPERRAASIAPRLPNEGITPYLAYPSRGLLWGAMKAVGINLIDYEAAGKFDFAAPAKISRIAKDINAALIHSQGPGSLDAAACIAGLIARKPVVITRPVMIEDIVMYSRLRRRIYALIDRLIVMRLATRIVAVSEAGLRHLIAISGAQRTRVTLVRNGAPIKSFRARSHTTSHGAAGEPPVVLGMIGHLLSYKGWDDFLNVIAALRKAGLNVRGEIVGEGEERPRLQVLARALDIERHVGFLGYRTDVADILQRFDILLFTSHREGLSMAVIEAMASGLPIIASAVGGIHEQIDEGTNGYVVPTKDIAAFSAMAATLVRDPGLRAKMGDASRARAIAMFDEDRMLREYADLYRAVARA